MTVSWATYGDQPLDPGQRDALVAVRVRGGAKGAKRLRLPRDWAGAWISARRGAGSVGDTIPMHLGAAGPWFEESPATAWAVRGRRAPRGLALALRVLAGGQVTLWRSGAALALRDEDEGADGLARGRGPALADVEGAPAAVPDLGWDTARLPGWVQGGPLHLDCPRHGEPLTHWRCDHARAVGRKRRFLAACPRCDAQDIAVLGKRLRALMAARAALDGELPESPPGAPNQPEPSGSGEPLHRVYVVEALSGDGERGFYVGQTTRSIEERLEQHRSAAPGAARVFRKGATVGDLRPDLVAEEWLLPTRSAALAAEAFTHLLVQQLHPGARIHGDVTLLGA